MKRIFTLLMALGLSFFAQAQTYQWTWTAGSNQPNPSGSYTSTNAPGNVPGGMQGAITWMGANGSLWLYGGRGLNSFGAVAYLTNLWQYQPATGQWTWHSGTQEGVVMAGTPVYGVKGVADVFVHPGPERSAPVTWIDKDHNLWLYGGRSSDGLSWYNDLWKYDIVTRRWMWVSGNNTPSSFFGFHHNSIRGALGETGPDYQPSPRSGGAGWTDAEGNLWLFGGIGWALNNNVGDLNDLWKYDISDKGWAWMGGGAGVFLPSVSSPGSRYGALTTTDSEGNLWLFGGYGASRFFTNKQLDDLWKYNPQTQAWTWVSGDNKYYTGSDAGALADMQNAIYGTKGQAAATNKPGAMPGSLTSDQSGRLWLLGKGELWQYTIASSQWTWMESLGTAAYGLYGTQGVTAPGNKPGTRTGSMIWTDAQQTVWLMGGYGLASTGEAGYLNDLWKLTSIAPAVVLSCTPSATANTQPENCAAVVSGIDPKVSAAGTAATITYTLTGATTGSGTGTVSGRPFNKGVTTVTYALANTPQQCSFTVTVTDNVTPVLSTLSASETMLWPANHQMQEVQLHYTANDNCGVTRTEVSVSSNEPQNGLGDGDMPNDWEIVNAHTIRLRAERSGKGSGRVYTVTVKAWDGAGNMSTRTTTVDVPKNKNDKTDKLQRLQVKALPTLSRTSFTLVLESGSPLPVYVRIYDEKGRTLDVRMQLQPNASFTLGHNYRPGVYYAEVLQGAEKAVVKLVKM